MIYTQAQFMDALWELHKERGGGYHSQKDIEARIAERAARIPPPLPLPKLPPLPPPPLPPLLHPIIKKRDEDGNLRTYVVPPPPPLPLKR